MEIIQKRHAKTLHLLLDLTIAVDFFRKLKTLHALSSVYIIILTLSK